MPRAKVGFSGEIQMDNNSKQKRMAKAKAEEAALNRMLYWVAGGAVLEFLLLLLNRYWAGFMITSSGISLHAPLDVTIRILAVAGLICAAGAFYWWRCAVKAGKGKDLPGVLCVFMAGLSASCFACWIFDAPGLKVMYVSVPVAIVLALIYYLYQREFFLIACQSALTLMGVWLSGEASGKTSRLICYAYVVLAAVLVLLGAGLCRKLQGGEGRLSWRGKNLRVFSKNANYALLYVGAIISLVLLVLAAIGVSSGLLYSVGVAWLLIMAVYYTVKLM